MIRSRPKPTTLFSLLLFLFIAYGVGIWAWFKIPPSPAWWMVVPVVCLVTALIITIKLLMGYRIITIDGDRWQVTRLITPSIEFTSNDIKWWKEIQIKTAGDMYKQLHVHAGKGKDAKVSLQEHTEYKKILNRLKTKHRQKEMS